MSSSTRISVAIPLHNEESGLPELLRRVGATLDALPGGPHEMVLVDDGSTDGTRHALLEAAAHDDRITAVLLSRNFGHQAAVTAALEHAAGDAVVVMDGDLQDAPEAIPAFVACFNEGYDVVYARRVRRKEGMVLRFCYWLFYRFLARMSDVELPIDVGDFGLMSRRVVDELRGMPEAHRYLRGMRSWVGYRQLGIDVERDARFAGDSKYTALKLLKLAFDGLFAFSVVPLRAAAATGAIAMLFSALFAAYSLFAKLFLGQSPRGFTALLLVFSFLSGVHLMFLGVIGEYVGRVYEEVKRRPHYVVDRVVRQRAVIEQGSGLPGVGGAPRPSGQPAAAYGG